MFIVKDFKLFVQEFEFTLITNHKFINYLELLAEYIKQVIIMNLLENLILNNYLFIFDSKLHWLKYFIVKNLILGEHNITNSNSLLEVN